jgi:putative inorganic carbon (HCO3(-)) transporter
LAVLLAGISAFHTIHPDRTVQSLLLLLAYLLAASLAAHAGREIPWAVEAFLTSISAAGVLASLVGTFHLLSGDEGGLYAQVLTGPFGYPNAAGGFFVLTAGAALGIARECRGITPRVAALAAAMLSVSGLMLTRSHGAMLAAAIGLVVWVGLDRTAWWPHRRVWAGVGVVALLLSIATLLNRLLSLPLRLWSLFAGGTPDSSFLWRLHILSWTWAMVRDHPWWGVGPGAYPVALIHYQHIPYASGQNPHNLYVEVAAEYGLPAAILLVLALATFFGRMGVAIHRTPAGNPGRGRLVVLVATLVAFAVHSLVDLDWSFPAIATTAAILLGLASAQLPQRIPRDDRGRPLWRGTILLLLLGMALLGLSRYYASTLVNWAQLAFESRETSLGLQDLRWALRLNPLSFPAHRSVAWARLSGGDPAGAVEAAEQSVRIAPSDPNTHYLAGEISATAGQWNAAVKNFQAAVDLAPTAQLRFHASLVESASNAGQVTEARFRYEQAVATFTEERVLGSEARCLLPGDRYLLARMSRIAAKAYGEVGDSPRRQAATDLAERLAQLDPRGICVSRGHPGQTSPEAAVGAFWQALTDGGWPQAKQFLTPNLRSAPPGKNLAMVLGEIRPRRAHVAWIAALQGNELEASLRFQVEIGTALDSLVIRCAQANTRLILDNWYLDSLPIIESIPCQP